MARWDNEQFNTQTPPSDIMCVTCKNKLKPITVAGYTQDRWGYGQCEKYTMKPQDVLWDHGLCPKYEQEDNT